MPLKRNDPHYWYPLAPVQGWLAVRVIKPDDLVVDVGCGHQPFPRADVGIDRLHRQALEKIWDEIGVKVRPPTFLRHDFVRDRLPYQDKEVDFVFCRHTLEDLYDPFALMAELQRVGKAGYIETPSPIAELGRGVDGYGNSEVYRGYYHHRWVVWEHDGVLNFVSKFPMIEHIGYREDILDEALRKCPEIWNTYYVWKDQIKWKYWENERDYEFADGYSSLLWKAAQQSSQSTDQFVRVVNEQMKEAAA